MIRLLFSLLVAAALAALAAFIADRPGRFVLDWQSQRIETSFAIALLALLLLLAVVLALYILLRRLFGAPGALKQSMAERRRDQGHIAFSRGMVALAAGDLRAAGTAADRVERLLPNSALGLLLGAQSAQLAGDRDGARRRFTAMVGRKDTELVGLRGLMSLAVQAGDQAEAARLAQQALAVRGDVPWALLILIEAAARSRRWVEAEQTIDTALKHQALPPADGRRKKAAVLTERARESQAANDLAAARKLAEGAVKLMPDHPAAASLLADVLLALGKKRRARAVLQSAWSAAPHPDIAAAWLRVHADAPREKQVAVMEELAGRVWSDEPAARLAMAQVALEAGDLGRARSELDAIAEPGVSAIGARAELDRRQYGDQNAGRDLAALAASAPRDPVWLCEACTHEDHAWTALCPRCTAFDTLRWRRPDTRALPAPPPVLALPPL
jgi:HemY protein